MPTKKRKEIASLGGKARWAKIPKSKRSEIMKKVRKGTDIIKTLKK